MSSAAASGDDVSNTSRRNRGGNLEWVCASATGGTPAESTCHGAKLAAHLAKGGFGRPFFDLRLTRMSVRTPDPGICIALIGLLCRGLVYWPGLSGPWLFDDFSNIRDNAFLRVTTLDWQSLGAAAAVARTRAAGRPVAYLQLRAEPLPRTATRARTPGRLTNVAIHGLNALLVAALLGTVLRRLAARGCCRRGWPRRRGAGARRAVGAAPDPDFQRAVRGAAHDEPVRHLHAGGAAVLVAGARALAGAGKTAPRTARTVGAAIAANDGVGGRSRLTPLAATGGMAPVSMPPWGLVAPGQRLAAGFAGGRAVLAVLGVFTKETAVLLPLYALVLDRVLYPDAPYWQRWLRVPAGRAAGAGGGGAGAWCSASPPGITRPATPAGRSR